MLLTVLVLSSVILMVAATAGLVMSFNLRQVTDARLSTKAIFAADTGIECVLDNYFCTAGTCPNISSSGCANLGVSAGGGNWKVCQPPPYTYSASKNQQRLSDGSYYELQCQPQGTNLSPNITSYNSTWTSTGFSPDGRTSRSLQVTITRL